MRLHKIVIFIFVIALFSLTTSVFASPQNVNLGDKVSIDVSGNGLVHAIIDKNDLAAQSTQINPSLTSRKAIMNEFSSAMLSPVLNNNGTERAQNVTVINGVIILGTNNPSGNSEEKR